jgi:hypothetical protein
MTDTWLLASGSIADKAELLGHAEIAVEYSGHRATNSDYEVVWWIRADQTESVRSALTGFSSLPTVRKALDQMHSLGFAYADLKSSNMLIPLNAEPVLFDFDNLKYSEYAQTSSADFPPADVAVTPASPSTWLNAGQGSAPETIASLSAQFNWPSIRQLAYTLAVEYPDTLAEDAMQTAWCQVGRAIQDAHGPTATVSLEPASYIAVSGAFVTDIHQAFLRYIDGVITVLSLLLVRVLAALARLGDFIDFILVIIAAFLHYGHRHEPGDDDSLPTRRNWTSSGECARD